jgi:hypothetical protein
MLASLGSPVERLPMINVDAFRLHLDRQAGRSNPQVLDSEAGPVQKGG